MKDYEHDPAYICTHLGEENAADVNCGAVVPPIYETSLHVFHHMQEFFDFSVDDPDRTYLYGRTDNHTVRLLERKLAALERAEAALCFASGMAAISSAALHWVKPGDHLITLRNVYPPAKGFFDSFLRKIGVETTYITGKDPMEFERAIRPNTAMFYLESPTSAVMELQDLRRVAQIAKRRGVKTAVDNTWATPLYQQPLELGIDMSIHTMSKYIGGHSDIIGGVICSDQETIHEIKNNSREYFGGILGPFEAWLALRGLRTLPSRLALSGANALAVARLLESSPRVARVNYPGLESYTQRALAESQITGGSGLLSVELDADPDQAVAFCDNLRIFRKGCSWGGFESLVSMPMYKLSDEEAAHRGGTRGLVRLYCGMESRENLLEDISASLDKMP